MATDYVLAWPSPDPVAGLPPATWAEITKRKRHAPGLWAQRLIPGVPADMPPGFSGAFSTCRGCPYACCEKCPPNDAWTEFHAREVEATTTRRRALWRRMTGRMPQEKRA